MYVKYTMPKIESYSTLDTAGSILMMALTCTLRAYSVKHKAGLENFDLFKYDHTHIQDPTV